MKRVLSRSLWAVAGLFVLYLLLIRVLAGWVQLMPTQAINIAQQVFNIEVQFKKLDIQQSWTGIDIHAQNLVLDTANWHFNVSDLSVDFHLLSPFWPSLAYGEQLKLQQAAFILHASDNKIENQNQSVNLDLALFTKLWRRVDVTDLLINAPIVSAASIEALHIDTLTSSRANRWSLLADIEVIHQKNHVPTSFQISARLDEDAFGLLSDGEIIIKQKQPLELAVLSDVFPDAGAILERIPQGELHFNAHTLVKKRKFQQLSLDVTLGQLLWGGEDASLPRSISARLDWHNDDVDKDGQQMLMTLSNVRLNHQPVQTLSPIRLTLVDNQLSLTLKHASLLPFKPTLNHLFGDLTQSLQRIDVRDVSLIFDLANVRLLQLDATLEALDWQTDTMDISAHRIRVLKKADTFKVQFHKPITAHTRLTEYQQYSLKLGSEWLFKLSDDHQAWSLTKHQAWLNDMSIELSAHGDIEGLLSARLDIKADSLEQVKAQLLPYELMPLSLQVWLKNALVAGENIEATAIYEGSWKKVDLINNPASLNIEAFIHNTQLKFDPHWPALENFTAKLNFTPLDLHIQTDSATMFGAQVKGVSAQINQLDHSDVALELSGRVVTQAQNGLDFLLASPLAKMLGLEYALQQVLKAGGEWIVGLDKIVIPLGSEIDPVQVQGFVDFNNGQLRLFDQLDLTKLAGKLNFNEKGAWAKDLSAQTLGGSVKADVKSGAESGVVDIHAKGLADLTGEQGFKGSLPWQLSTSIPLMGNNESPLRVSLQAQPLALTSDWPYPLSTADLQGSDFEFELYSQDTGFVAQAELTNIFSFDTSLKPAKDNGIELNFAHIQLGQKTSKIWKKGRGIQLHGHLKLLDIDRLIKQASVISKLIPSNVKPTSLKGVFWHATRLELDNVVFLQHTYPAINLDWTSIESDPRTYLAINSDYLKAFIKHEPEIGLDVSLKKLALVLPEADLAQPDTVVRQCLAPVGEQLWPSIRFTGTNISIDQRHFNSLDFVLEDNAQLRQLNDIKFKFANNAGQGVGSYRWDKVANQSYTELSLTSKKVEALSDFVGIKKGFSGDKGQFDAKVNWFGGFECFRLDALAGSLAIRFDNGVIEQIEPGFARLLGLLSVDSVLRRLRLDLKDVTEKGLEYDYIEARAIFNGAKLNLNDFKLKSPGVSVEIKGDVMLGTKTFDLDAEVTPAMGAALPVVAGLLGLTNPVTGVLVYVLAKNLPFINEDIITYDYKVTGPWLDPDISSSGGSVLFK